MAKAVEVTVTALVSLLLFCFTLANAGRTKLVETNPTSAAASVDGVCNLMVLSKGFSCEEHQVTTKDGCILGLQRIPNGRDRSKKSGNKIPVLLQHGILSDATTWLSNSPSQSLGFILADNNYDVWLANVRGTRYSRGHTSLSPTDAEYWNWSWDELAAYDLPAFVQYIYEQTGQKTHYVGHSLGTLMAVGAFSTQEVVNMVRSAALFSPIAYMGRMPSPLARAAADIFVAEVVYWLGLHQFSAGGGPATKLLRSICTKGIINCNNLDNMITGPNCCLNTSKPFLPQEPTATKNMIHLSQMIRGGTIQMYDYGSDDNNNDHYGQADPPTYNMASIPNNLPLFLAYGGKDLLSDVNDVQTLINSLADHEPDKLVQLYMKDYAHLDFVGGLTAHKLVYDPLMAFFKLN